MPGYLIWLNARLYEMKRLLKKTGSIYVHLDWHAAHYVKIELDKIFGHENFLNEVYLALQKLSWKRKTLLSKEARHSSNLPKRKSMDVQSAV